LQGKTRILIGRVISAIPVVAMLFSAAGKLTGAPQMIAVMVGTLGFMPETLLLIALLEITCVVLYAIPRTAVLGAVLMTGYLGGAIAAHVRVSDNVNLLAPLLLGVLAWIGLYLRDARVRALLPLHS
jgi:hypothetical protein